MGYPFIPNKENTVTDKEEGTCHIDGKWMLLPKYLQLTFELF